MTLYRNACLALLALGCSSQSEGSGSMETTNSSLPNGGSTTMIGGLPPDMNMPVTSAGDSTVTSSAGGNSGAATGAQATGGAATGDTGMSTGETTAIGGNGSGMTATGGTENLGQAGSGTGAPMAVGGMRNDPGAMSAVGGSSNEPDNMLDGAGGAEDGTGGTAIDDEGMGEGGANLGQGGMQSDLPEGLCQVQPLSAEFRQDYDNLDPFYTKYADANGLPIISSDSPADEALERACELVIDMVSARPDVLDELIRSRVRFAIIGEDELTNDIPEYSYLEDSINERARGLGGVPAASCAEESILCNTNLDRWRGEGICVHEFAHTISTGGLFRADSTFESRLRAAYQNAQDSGLFANTYAMENFQEYWAEGVQDWYYTNLEADPPNGIHNHIDRREELQEYDPALYELVAEFLPDQPRFVDCYSDE